MRITLLWFGLIGVACSSFSEPIGEADDVSTEKIGPQPQAQNAGATAPPTAAPSTSTSTNARAASTSAGASAPDPPGSKRFEATVRVAKVTGDHKRAFAGVSLERAEGPPVIASYSAAPVWSALDGRRVKVLAVPYQPTGRAIMGEHMTVLALSLVQATPQDPVVAFGPEKELVGRFARVAGEPGSKAAEGAPALHFVVDAGASYVVAFGTISDQAEKDVKKVRARTVELSRFSAHSGGPFVWITSTSAIDAAIRGGRE